MKWLTLLVIAIAIAASLVAALLYAAGGIAAQSRKDHDCVYSAHIAAIMTNCAYVGGIHVV